jgi:hypothetical protein
MIGRSTGACAAGGRNSGGPPSVNVPAITATSVGADVDRISSTAMSSGRRFGRGTRCDRTSAFHA